MLKALSDMYNIQRPPQDPLLLDLSPTRYSGWVPEREEDNGIQAQGKVFLGQTGFRSKSC